MASIPINLLLAYAGYVGLSTFAFFRYRNAAAVGAIMVTGLALLPAFPIPSALVQSSPDASAVSVLPYWIIGSMLPSEASFSKAWFVPSWLALLAMATDKTFLRGLRWGWADLGLALWCVWPLLQSGFRLEMAPAGYLQSLYLFGSWGTAWLLGRSYLRTHEDCLALIRVVGVIALLYLPLAALETLLGPQLHELLFAPHPFANDGAVRYVGYRPLGFFEHGNQYGIWIALSALAAVWQAISAVSRAPEQSRLFDARGIAWALVVAMLASQSVGAIALFLFGLALMLGWHRLRPKRLFIIGLLGVLLLGAVYFSGRLPVERLARQTEIGQQVLGAFRSIGRGSFPWRVSQDQKALQVLQDHKLLGTGQWNWWRSANTRPWGLVQLIFGQYGVVGLVLFLWAFAASAIARLWHCGRSEFFGDHGAPALLSLLVLLALLDSALNSFIFPAIALLAGGLAAPVAQRRPEAA